MTTALFETEVGNINIEFFSDDAPNTVKNFIPKTAEDRLLISPPQKNLEVENWEEDKNSKKDNIDINTIKENLEKLL